MMRTKDNAGSALAQIGIRKRMQLEQGFSWQVELGGIWAPSPLNQLSLCWTWPAYPWGQPRVSLYVDPLNQFEYRRRT
jgi:hypothetical protein